ncbi:OmpA family protein [Yoonia sp.]|uniref:OmpA family protein n=1 Tax=Yoonia sp. TaxID=2212373 RepID=UPI0025F5DDC0|nr:OmpA family protein [Yoonia sp.]
MIFLLLGLFLSMAGAAHAQTLDFPSNASLEDATSSDLDSYAMPVGIWANGALPAQVIEGQLTRQAWRIAASGLTTLQLLRPLREQLRNDRFRIIFECQTEACGGFDFRFGVETLPPPQMQINVGDFRFLSAERMGADGPEYISLFVSRTTQAGFVQVTRVGPPQQEPERLATSGAPPLRASGSEPASGGLADRLDTTGHAVLGDLTFDTGSSQLGEGPFASLQALADYLAAFPDRTVALVGHTDSSGSLVANIALSKRRAGSVLERLISNYGVSRRQLGAEGMGYLSPIASNLTDAGREANRRVEVIITSTSE